MARIACLWIPHMIAQAEGKRQNVGAKTLIVYDGEFVLDSCAQAYVQGVRPNDPLHQALARCPDAMLLQADRDYYQKLSERILDALEIHCPLIEMSSWGLAYLEAQGMGDLYGSELSWCQAVQQQIEENTGLDAQVGVAHCKFAAWIAAQADSADRIVEKHDAFYLAPLSIDHLPLSREAYRRLNLLGIRTMGHFARLPGTTVAEQFGPESIEAHHWAKGLDNRPIIGQRQRIIEADAEFEWPESQQSALIEAMLASTLQPLDQLVHNGLSVRRIALFVQLADGSTWKKSSWTGGMLGPAKIETTFSHMINSLKGDGPGVVSIQIRLIGLEPIAGKQLNLFARTENKLRMDNILQKLSKKHSADCVLRPHAVTPDASIIGERYNLEGVPT